MSNKDIINFKGNPYKMYINLFSFSNLKSKAELTLSPYNSFAYKFDIKNGLINGQFVSKFGDSKKPLIDRKNYNILKNLNIDIPSSQTILDQNFQNKFMNEYDTSFAHFCGLNKSQFEELYIKNQYIPSLNEFGDLNIPINNIVELLNIYSHSVKLKITRKVLKKYRTNKMFKTFQKIKKKQKNNHEIENILLDNNSNYKVKNNNNIINIDENNNNISNKEIDINNISKNNNFLNLKNRLKLEIQNNNPYTPLRQDNIVNKYQYHFKNDIINDCLSYNFKNIEKNEEIIPNYKPPLIVYNKQTNITTPNNNFYKFAPGFNNNIYNISTNFNNISSYNILSPSIISPYLEILTPSSHNICPSNISSPNIFSFSPFHNNSIYNDQFTFNNSNIIVLNNSSPFIPKKNIYTNYNNIININNNKNDNNQNNKNDENNNNKN